jgi:hypothetical protein
VADSAAVLIDMRQEYANTATATAETVYLLNLGQQKYHSSEAWLTDRTATESAEHARPGSIARARPLSHVGDERFAQILTKLQPST